MAEIDFSALPKESSNTMTSWFRAFGVIKAFVLIALILVFGILANIYTTPGVQVAAVICEIIVVFAAGYMAASFNRNRESKFIQDFAKANDFEYQDGGPMPTKDLPSSISSQFTAKSVKLYYRLSGKINSHDFELFHVRGLYYAIWNRAYIDVVVLEIRGAKKTASSNENIKTEAMDNGTRVILSGNAVSAEDMESVFTAAGIS